MLLREKQNLQIYQGAIQVRDISSDISYVLYFFCAALCRATSLVGIYYPPLWIICMCPVIPRVSCNLLSHWSPLSWRDRTQQRQDVFALSTHTTRPARANRTEFIFQQLPWLVHEGKRAFVARNFITDAPVALFTPIRLGTN